MSTETPSTTTDSTATATEPLTPDDSSGGLTASGAQQSSHSSAAAGTVTSLENIGDTGKADDVGSEDRYKVILATLGFLLSLGFIIAVLL
jgi:hypothetical protein